MRFVSSCAQTMREALQDNLPIEGPPGSGIQTQTDARRRRDAGHTLPSGDCISYEERMMRGVINIVIGLVFIVGGLTGKLSMRGTNSGGALAVIGVALVGLGGYRMMTRR
jgi:hypothetical protein